jgi:hypothetical protein
VICKGDKGMPFNHVLKVFDGLIYCQELAVVRTVLLMRGAAFKGVENQGLPSVAGMLL